MNCARSIELLPWLLNGTLDPDERQEVLEHLGGCENCRQALADTRLAWQVFDQHLPSEALVALAWDEMSASVAGVDPALAELHLATCPECAAELELARTSRRLEEDDRIAVLTPRTRPSPPAGRTSFTGWRAAALAAGLAGVVASAGWLQTAQRARSLEDELARRPAATAAPVEPRPSDPAPSSPTTGGAADQVAALEKRLGEMRQTTAALQQRESELRSQLAQGDRGGPQLNTYVTDLFPLAAIVRGAEAEAPKLPAHLDATLLLSPDPQKKPYPAYDLEILDASGKAMWSVPGLRRDERSGGYNVSLPKGSLRPGTYTIQVYGRSGAAREPAERYQIRVE